MARIALIVLVALAFSNHSTRDVLRGPPLICFEIDIGSAKSVTSDRQARDSRPSNDALMVDTQRVLAESDDALVHMETLRRAYFYLGGSPRGGINGPAPTTPAVARFGGILKDAVLLASVPRPPGNSGDARRETLAWFDLGYFLAIKENCRHGRELLGELSCHPILERAAAGAPHDAALQFGVAFGQIHNAVEDAAEQPLTEYWWAVGKAHLVVAMDLTKDRSSLLAKNICALLGRLGPYGSPTTFEEIRTSLAAESRPK